MIQFSFAEVFYRLRHPCFLLPWLWDRLADPVRDWQFGIRSSRRVRPASLTANMVSYQPVSYRDWPGIMEVLPHGPDDVFLDCGCGMGRAVCLAGREAYCNVMGVEVAHELVSQAIRNVRAVGGSATIVHADARAFEVPPFVTVVMMFNPFRGDIMAEALERLRESVVLKPRRLTVGVFGSPIDDALDSAISTCGWLRLERKTQFPTGCIGMVYTNVRRMGVPSHAQAPVSCLNPS